MKFFIVALLLMGITSCSDGREQTERELRGILSWSATAEMVLDARAKMLVPDSFAALTLERCGKEIANLSKALPASPQNLAALAGRLNATIAAAHDEIVDGRTDGPSRNLQDLRRLNGEWRAKSGAAQ